MKTTPVTTRLSQADQEFLSRLKISDATTISEKLRGLIAEERVRQQAQRDYRTALESMIRLLEPASTGVQVEEKKSGLHSQVVRRILEWLPDAMAVALAESPRPDDEHGTVALEKLEDELTVRVLRLAESVLQSALSAESAVYRPEVLHHARLKPLLQLGRLTEVRNATTNQEGQGHE